MMVEAAVVVVYAGGGGCDGESVTMCWVTMVVAVVVMKKSWGETMADVSIAVVDGDSCGGGGVTMWWWVTVMVEVNHYNNITITTTS